MRKRVLTAGVLAAGVAAAGAFAASQMGPTVGVSLKEFKVIAPKSSKAGKITFVVRNKGRIKHEFIVVRTNRAPGKLPLKGNRAKLTGVKGMLRPFKPGKTRKLTLTLKRGKYVLLCNLPGHYKAGQFKGFRVR